MSKKSKLKGLRGRKWRGCDEMTKLELLKLMRLLSGVESLLLYNGRQHLNERAALPESLMREMAECTTILEREILAPEFKDPEIQWPEIKGPMP